MKSLGDDIANKGKPSLVQPFEKQVFKRWEDLEKKFEVKISDAERKIQLIKEQEEREEEERLQSALKLIEEQKQQEKKVEVIEEEVILPESARSAESAPTMIEEVPVNIELVTQDESVGNRDGMWIMKRETESKQVKQYAEVNFVVTSKTVENSTYSVYIYISLYVYAHSGLTKYETHYEHHSLDLILASLQFLQLHCRRPEDFVKCKAISRGVLLVLKHQKSLAKNLSVLYIDKYNTFIRNTGIHHLYEFLVLHVVFIKNRLMRNVNAKI